MSAARWQLNGAIGTWRTGPIRIGADTDRVGALGVANIVYEMLTLFVPDD